MNKATDHMSPDASPGEVPGTSGVRRVNNLPLYIVGGVMGVFLLAMAMVAWDRAQQQNRPAAQAEPKASDTAMFARAITGERKDGIVPAAAVSPPAIPDPAPASGGFAVPIARPANLDLPPVPPRSQGQPAPGTHDESEERIRVVKLQQLDEAIRSKTALSTASARSAASSPITSPAGAAATREDNIARLAAVRQQLDAATRDDPAAAYMARLQQIQMAGIGGGPTQGAQPPAEGSRNDIAQFAGAGQGDRWQLQARPEAPRSAYELRAGFVVPATLISGINSELPGQIVAQVSQDVFDTPTGNFRLIPQGSRLVGAYSSEVAYGQARILVAWQRIVFPDGKAMDIGSMPGADSAGFAGFKDQVNNHYWRLFSSAVLMSGVIAGIALSQPDTVNINARPTTSSAMSEALGQQLGQVTAQLISKNLNIAPTLEIRPGYRFNVIVTKDMTFSKPYRAFDY